MQLDKLQYGADGWSMIRQAIGNPDNASLILVFGDSDLSNPRRLLDELHQRYPNAWIAGASTCGNILGDEINRHEAVATAIQLQQGSVHCTSLPFVAGDNIERLAQRLHDQLPTPHLKHVLVFSDGLQVNGSELARGFNHCPHPVTGGLAGDSTRFEKTWVMANDMPAAGQIVAIGLYGDNIQVECGSYAGWSAFGANRRVTRSQGNCLYELDHEPALALYKRYLGDFANELPDSGMRFPLCIETGLEEEGIIRTLLGINEAEQSITFAGDIPEGCTVRLMHPNFNRLIEGVANTVQGMANHNPEQQLGTGLALVVSCGGRRSVLGVQTDEELGIIRDHLPADFWITGFYSYGELGPLKSTGSHCHLHNQTVTVTCIHEHGREDSPA
ncbi:FIST signal transduction protein [Parathalassolituus penaei]|uniref:FIST C-terminal domain-containing protein n=1 Tax=Parathalassolituus penaei TaxID=2997323 RepID=A0A9X3EGC3_9GAMM|nr:FIST N-terminal domain-containing protein [Parathalassolituus penaei]MCY0966705.1 FIST C-terminal domain-containing protein [Parathalassolituus penaei]